MVINIQLRNSGLYQCENGGFSGTTNYEHNFRVNMERQLTSVAQLKVEQIFQWRKEKLGDGATLLKNPA
jgi:hypothetical protein